MRGPGPGRTAFLLGLFWPIAGSLFLLILVLVDHHSLAARRHWPSREILAAIRFVESSDCPDPPDGDDGRAIGPYQIHRPYWLDALLDEPEIGGNYRDCRDRTYAERIVAAYMRRYVPAAWASGDAQVIARVHNGGPNGPDLPTTLAYWQKVRRRLTR